MAVLLEDEDPVRRVVAGEEGARRTELDVVNGVGGGREGAHVFQSVSLQHLLGSGQVRSGQREWVHGTVGSCCRYLNGPVGECDHQSVAA